MPDPTHRPTGTGPTHDDPADRAAHRAASFGSAAEEYDRRRAAVPRAALDWMLTGTERSVLDLAAGTGQISRRLDRPGLRTIAVEPDPEMRAVLAHHCPHAQVLDGVAEAIPLPTASVDAVLVGSAWHWFEPAAALAEVARVLRPGGRLGVTGLSPDPFVDWVAALLGPYAGAHRDSVRRRYVDVSLDSSSFGPIERHEVPFTVSLSPPDVRALFATHSYYLVATDEQKARLDAQVLSVLDDRFPAAPSVELPFRAWCWRTVRLAGPAEPTRRPPTV